MILSLDFLKNKADWEAKGYILPEFDVLKVREKTKASPKWVHFGAGNIFRSFPAMLLQTLLNTGEEDTGLIVVEGFDYEIIDKIYRPHDNLSILVTLNPDGRIEKRIIGSVAEAIAMDRDRKDDFDRLRDIVVSPTLQVMSLTITEKGYAVTDKDGSLLRSVLDDIERGPQAAETYMGRLTALLYERFSAGRTESAEGSPRRNKLPLAVVSMDNFSHNGERLRESVLTFAKGWNDNNLVENEFVQYLEDENSITFPWSMIDKITPRPAPEIEALLKEDGLEDVGILVTEKNTFISAFVNAEKPEYLVIEDSFPQGRPKLEKSGVIFTSRDKVNLVEKMKVCTCLNPLHTCLAIFGCLLGYTKISDEMEDEDIRKLVTNLGYKEALPVVTDPEILNPKDFIREVLEERIPNPFVPDTPQRIATDTSQKIPIRFGETIKAYVESSELDVNDLTLIPLVLAGWIRYLMGVDDEGKAFEVSPDPLYENIKEGFSDIFLGQRDVETVRESLEPLLKNDKIFGLNLCEVGLDGKVISYFMDMAAEAGAVRATVHNVVSNLE